MSILISGHVDFEMNFLATATDTVGAYALMRSVYTDFVLYKGREARVGEKRRETFRRAKILQKSGKIQEKKYRKISKNRQQKTIAPFSLGMGERDRFVAQMIWRHI